MLIAGFLLIMPGQCLDNAWTMEGQWRDKKTTIFDCLKCVLISVLIGSIHIFIRQITNYKPVVFMPNFYPLSKGIPVVK